MSTITEARTWRRVGTILVYALVALVSWFGSLALVARLLEPTAAVIVIGPGSRADAASAIDADVDLLDASTAFVIVAGRSRGFVKQLYAGGAWLVLPIGSGGCRRPIIQSQRVAQGSFGLVQSRTLQSRSLEI